MFGAVKKVVVLCLPLLFVCAQEQTSEKYIDSIFAQKGGVNIFFYKPNRDNAFLQKQNLIAALYSKKLKMELANQLGVFFTDNSYEINSVNDNSMAATMGLKVGDKIVNFGGINFSDSRIDAFHETNANDQSPSFMLTIKRQGDTLQFGGGIKDLPFKEWSDTFMKKYYEP
jgi:predicted metalloprotease with PDZ domain